MNIQKSGLALLAAMTLATAPMLPALAEMQPQPVQLAQTTIERERDILPDSTPNGGDVVIKERDGLTTREIEIDEDTGAIDENDTEYAGFSLMTWIVLGLVALAVIGYFMSRRHRAPVV